MLRYIGTRLLQMIPVLFGITLISFALMYLSPSDPAMMMLTAEGNAPTPDLVEAVRHEMGLDQPAYIQYLNWLVGMFHGDFGVSHTFTAPVASVLLLHLGVTLILSLLALIVVLVVAIPLGVLAGLKHNSVVDYLIQIFEYSSFSMPTFWLALLLIYLFAVTLGVLPAISNSTMPEGYVLPVVALLFSYLGRLIGQVRVDVIEEMKKPYIVGLRSRGLSMKTIVRKHVLRNALMPSITIIGLIVGALLSGSLTTEIVFSLEGLGSMAVQAITTRDYFLVQGYVFITAVFFIVVNLIVDILYHVLNPQVNFTHTRKARTLKGTQAADASKREESEF